MRLKFSNFPILFLFLFFVSCSSVDEGAIVGTWQINPDKCELSIDDKILNVLPNELSDQFGGQLAMVPIMFKQGLKEESSSMKIKINEDGLWEPIIDNEAERNDVEDDVLSSLKWNIKGNKLNITYFLPYGNEGMDGPGVSDELKKEIEERNKKALENSKIEVVFDIKELNATDMLLSLDIESLIDAAKEKGLVDEAEKGLSSQFGGLDLDPEKILKSIAKNIKLTLAFKKV